MGLWRGGKGSCSLWLVVLEGFRRKEKRDGRGAPVNASSGRTRMSRLRKDDPGAEASRESARAMFSSTKSSLAENWRVAIRIVRGCRCKRLD